MKITITMPDASMIEELGRRAQQQRIGLNLTQAQLADTSGVSARTIERFEAGTSIQLDKLVRILRALRLAENLDQLIPDAGIRPLQLVSSKTGIRHRAYTRKVSGQPKDGHWVWGDKK